MSGVHRIGHARWTGALPTGAGTISAESGAFTELPYTFASRTAQKSELTDPEELLAAAHAGCFAMALSSVLTEDGVVDFDLAVSAEVTLDQLPEGRRITRSDLTVEVHLADAGDQAWLDTRISTADERCPFSALIREAGLVTVTASIMKAAR